MFAGHGCQWLLRLRWLRLRRLRRLQAGGGGMCIYVEGGTLPSCLIICELFSKVFRILRDCGLRWCEAHIRYVRLYCSIRHMEGRTCARRRDVGNCVTVIVDDIGNAVAYGRPTNKFLHQLEHLEMDILTNIAVSRQAVIRFR